MPLLRPKRPSTVHSYVESCDQSSDAINPPVGVTHGPGNPTYLHSPVTNTEGGNSRAWVPVPPRKTVQGSRPPRRSIKSGADGEAPRVTNVSPHPIDGTEGRAMEIHRRESQHRPRRRSAPLTFVTRDTPSNGRDDTQDTGADDCYHTDSSRSRSTSCSQSPTESSEAGDAESVDELLSSGSGASGGRPAWGETDHIEDLSFLLPKKVMEQRWKAVNDMMQLVRLKPVAEGVGSGRAASIEAAGAALIPASQIGYVARGVGLNPTIRQIRLMVVELLGDSSCGDAEDLEACVLDGGRVRTFFFNLLCTKVFKGEWIGRESERAVFEAFRVLDTEGKGYLTPAQLRAAMQTGEEGEAFTDEEVTEMLSAATEMSWAAEEDSDSADGTRHPEERRIYYANFASFMIRD